MSGRTPEQEKNFSEACKEKLPGLEQSCGARWGVGGKSRSRSKSRSKKHKKGGKAKSRSRSRSKSRGRRRK